MNNRRSFIVGIKSLSLTNEEKKFLKKFKPWGVILFSRNIKSIAQSQKLTKAIKTIFKDKNYPILVDQEGGRVNRLKKIFNFDTLTSEYFGNLYLKDKKKFSIYYKIFIEKTIFFLKSIGININTVPVLDLRKKGASNIIGNRSFSDNHLVTSKIGDYCINLFQDNNVGTVIKHIPGHGLAKVDSHKSTPLVKANLNYLLKNDFAAFKNKKSFFAMTAHIIYQSIDKKNTATHSKKVMSIIRKKIKFNGIIISDDISMKGLKYSTKENTIRAFKSGCNLVLHCNGSINQMLTVARNSPLVNDFIIKKTSQFYKILS
jgi:beta-N-acetylhexosaminidase